jgi:hypothetical protein
MIRRLSTSDFPELRRIYYENSSFQGLPKVSAYWNAVDTRNTAWESDHLTRLADPTWFIWGYFSDEDPTVLTSASSWHLWTKNGRNVATMALMVSTNTIPLPKTKTDKYFNDNLIDVVNHGTINSGVNEIYTLRTLNPTWVPITSIPSIIISLWSAEIVEYVESNSFSSDPDFVTHVSPGWFSTRQSIVKLTAP